MLWCQYLGYYKDWGTPVPIPNTEVKPIVADGSASNRCARVSSCQDIDIKQKSLTKVRLFLFLNIMSLIFRIFILWKK